MQKLSYDVLKKLQKSRATSAEISLLIYMSQYQDDCGSITGLYYRDACENIGISYQTFYDCLKGLEAKGLVRCAKNSRTDYDVTVTDNDFSDGDYSRGYISTGHAIFSDKKFHAMKAGAKLMAMDLVKIAYSKGGSYIIGTEKLYANYTDMLGVTKRVIRGYLHQVKEFFSIGIKDGKYYITPKSKVARQAGSITDKDKTGRWFVRVLMRRHRLEATAEQVKDLAGVMSRRASAFKESYGSIWETKLSGLIEKAVLGSIERMNEGLPKRKEKRKLNVPFVNKIFMELAAAEA